MGELFLLLWALTATGTAIWLAVAPALEPPPDLPPLPEMRLPPALKLEPASFAELVGWQEDALSEALPPFLASCTALAKLPAERSLGPRGIAGTAGEWRAPCERARRLGAVDDPAARAFFEAEMRPFRVSDRGREEGLFTGYFEPTLQGSRRRRGKFTVPLYLRPPEMVSVDLGAFRSDLAGRRIAGRVKGQRLVPFAERREIDRGALAGRGLEMVWVSDAVDAFFLHIQGSGRVELAEGGFLRVGYADQNGHPYVAIGRELVARGALTLEEVSLQSIRAWLSAHPEEAAEVMAANPSYVFFRRLEGSSPVGSLGVELTPRRSLAVDRAFLPLGAPLWLETQIPGLAAPGGEGSDGVSEAPAIPWHHLMLAQDTGGAIRGPVRGDVFWGPGEEAMEIAGRMKHPGRLWLFLPRAVGPHPAAPASSR